MATEIISEGRASFAGSRTSNAIIADTQTAAVDEQACHSKGPNRRRYEDFVQGQAFNSTGGWNVIVGMANGQSC